jgi:hypothetical protein
VRAAYPEGLAWRWPVSESWFRTHSRSACCTGSPGEGEDHWIVRAEDKLVGASSSCAASPDGRPLPSRCRLARHGGGALLRIALRAGAQHRPLSLESAVTDAEEARRALGFARHHTLIWMEKLLEGPGRI